MTKKNVFLALIMAALATLYVVYFTDWFRHKTLHIYHTNRNLNPERGAAAGLIFGMEGKYVLKEIKVVPLAEYQKNPNAAPVWHLVAKNHSAPLKFFYYGQGIEGMTPYLAGDQAQQLDPTTTYRIFITTDKMSGFHDFNLGGPVTPDSDTTAGH